MNCFIAFILCLFVMESLEFMCVLLILVCAYDFCVLLVLNLNMENAPSVHKESPWEHILNKRAKYSCGLVTKKEMIFYCNSVLSQYMLGSEEQWPLNGSLNYYYYYLELQLELFCERADNMMIFHM